MEPEEEEFSSVIHVYPVGDFRTHSCSLSEPCWCGPEIDEDHNGTLVVHKSLDGREKYETGERVVS